MRIVVKNSPNQSNRLPGNVGLIICHTPEGSYDGTISWVMNPDAQVSYHVLIKRDGTEAVQFVPWNKKAWHALVYNSLSDGIAVEGFARSFNLADEGSVQLSKLVAERLVARELKPQWTTDAAKGGFCRHADLQSDRTDPTPDLNEWKLFVAMVKSEYEALTEPNDWPIPVPQWFWTWARWRLGVSEFKPYGPANEDHRPGYPVPAPGLQWGPGGKYFWAWRRLQALQMGQQE